MTSTTIIWSFLVAALLGFLIGLERERKRERIGSIFAGIRTFPLLALYGALAGTLSQLVDVSVLVVAFLPLAVLVGLSYWRVSAGEKVGGTTEVAVLVAFALGVLAGLEQYVVALAGAVIATGVLSLREELHHLAGALTREDLFAVVQFAAVSLIILPLVPDQNYGPWGVWNPRVIWLLVVLISGISFVGYVASKLIGTTRGIGLAGLLGGLASSTAVTLAFSRRSRELPALGSMLAVGVLAATAVAAPRLLFLLGVVQPSLVLPAIAPLGALFIITTIGGMLVYRQRNRTSFDEVEIANPFELRTALQFAALFAIVLLGVRAAEEFFGVRGIYLASSLAGITQLDAITLSLARQVQEGLDPTIAGRSLALAVASNSLFKAGLALTLGSRSFGWLVTATLLLAGAGCVAAAWLI